jgi:hypothetical protein
MTFMPPRYYRIARAAQWDLGEGSNPFCGRELFALASSEERLNRPGCAKSPGHQPLAGEWQQR